MPCDCIMIVPMMSLWLSCAVPTSSVWFAYDAPMIFLGLYCDFHMIWIWFWREVSDTYSTTHMTWKNSLFEMSNQGSAHTFFPAAHDMTEFTFWDVDPGSAHTFFCLCIFINENVYYLTLLSLLSGYDCTILRSTASLSRSCPPPPQYRG